MLLAVATDQRNNEKGLRATRQCAEGNLRGNSSLGDYDGMWLKLARQAVSFA
jgi:hypothetical protein